MLKASLTNTPLKSLVSPIYRHHKASVDPDSSSSEQTYQDCFPKTVFHTRLNMAPGGRGRAGKYSKPTRGGKSMFTPVKIELAEENARRQEVQQKLDSSRRRWQPYQHVGCKFLLCPSITTISLRPSHRTSKAEPKPNPNLPRKRTTKTKIPMNPPPKTKKQARNPK